MELEFYTFNHQVWYKQGENCSKLTEESTEVIAMMIDTIESLYPEAYRALLKIFKPLALNQSVYRHRIVQRFCKCNFGVIDTTKMDVDKVGRFNFEYVPCPLRGECPHENVVCNPQISCNISESEMRVLALVYDGVDGLEIAEQLFLSPHTVRNHIRNAYMRLELHSKAEFIIFARKNNLFKK